MGKAGRTGQASKVFKSPTIFISQCEVSYQDKLSMYRLVPSEVGPETGLHPFPIPIQFIYK